MHAEQEIDDLKRCCDRRNKLALTSYPERLRLGERLLSTRWLLVVKQA
jgi:hypothetical protein